MLEKKPQKSIEFLGNLFMISVCKRVSLSSAANWEKKDKLNCAVVVLDFLETAVLKSIVVYSCLRYLPLSFGFVNYNILCLLISYVSIDDWTV